MSYGLTVAEAYAAIGILFALSLGWCAMMWRWVRPQK